MSWEKVGEEVEVEVVWHLRRQRVTRELEIAYFFSFHRRRRRRRRIREIFLELLYRISFHNEVSTSHRSESCEISYIATFLDNFGGRSANNLWDSFVSAS